MKGRTALYGFVLLLSALILGGCAPVEPQVVVSTDDTLEGREETEYAAARDASLAYVVEYYDQDVPAPDSVWTSESPAPDGWAGPYSYEYGAGDWVVTITRLAVLPDEAAYRVIAINEATEFWWSGEVDPSGQVAESPPRPPATGFAAARDAALEYLAGRFGEQALPSTVAWTEAWVVLEGPVDMGGYRYSADDWLVTITYPLIGPRRVTFRVRVANEIAGFRWEGHVEEDGRVSSAPEDVVAARDAALAYIWEQYGDQAPARELNWMAELTTPDLLPGSINYRFTAGDWVVTVDTAIVPLDQRVYRLSVTNSNTEFLWEGQVDADGSVMEGP